MSTIIKTYNVPLALTAEQATYWINTLKVARDVYNYGMKVVFANKVNGKVASKRASVHDACYHVVREKFPQFNSNMLLGIITALAGNISTLKANRKLTDIPPKSHSLSLQLNKHVAKNLTPFSIYSTTCKGTLALKTYPKFEEMMAKYKAGDPKIGYNSRLGFYLSVPFKVESSKAEEKTAVGIDLGARMLWVSSEGNAFRDKVYLRERRKIRYLRRCLQAKGTKSAKRHLKALRRREQNLSKDMCQRGADALIQSTKAEVIVMEDLSRIKTNTSRTKSGYKRKAHNRALGQVPFFQFRQILTYKALCVGKHVATVDPKFTSKTDYRYPDMILEKARRGRRFYALDGKVFDADWNASVNIMARLKTLAEDKEFGKFASHPNSYPNAVPLDGGLQILDGHVPCQCTERGGMKVPTASPRFLIVGN